MTRILVAAHGGPSSRGAVRVAPFIAERMEAIVDVVGVVTPTRPVDYGFGATYVTEDIDREIEQQLVRELADQFAHCGAAACKPVIRHGVPAMEIAAAARAMGDALIVVGLGPHHAFDRALGGETALQLVQVASAPVLAVPEAATTVPHRMVVGVDFTPSSVGAARTAARLLVEGDALHLIHVEPTDGHGASAPDSDGQHTSAHARLAALHDQLQIPRGVRVECAVIAGPVSKTLLDHLHGVEADTIALGSHGYGLWKRLTIGSVASKLLRLAGTFVLVQPIGSVVGPVV